MRVTSITRAGSDWNPEEHVHPDYRPPPPPQRKKKPQIEEKRAAATPQGKTGEEDVKARFEKAPDLDTALETAVMALESGAAANKEGLTADILDSLPPLHPKQQEINDHPAKRKVINCGRRFGKTFLGGEKATRSATMGDRVLLASTSQEQADAFWEYVNKWLHRWIESGLIIRNVQKRILLFPFSGGRIRVKTASDADSLRGDWGNVLIFDECSRLEEKAWREVGAPMLLDHDGEAWFLSTPNRRNWYFYLYEMAVADESGDYQEFQATSYDNPHLSTAALQRIITDMGGEDSDEYRQEILAEFLEGEGAVFRNIVANLTARITHTPAQHKGHYIVAGADWGFVKDFTVLSIFCVSCMEEVYLDRFNKLDTPFQIDRVTNTHHLWGVQHWRVEINSIGLPIFHLLVEQGLPVEAFDTTMMSKGQLIRSFALCLEQVRGKWQPSTVPVGRIAKGELEAYEAHVSKVTGHTTYSAPSGVHDDTVMARALVWWAVLHATPQDFAASTLFYSSALGAQTGIMGAHVEPGPHERNEGTDYAVTAASSAPYQTASQGLAYAQGYNRAVGTPAGRPW